MVFELLKAGRGDDTAAHYVVTCDLVALGRISDAAVFMACKSDVLPEVKDSINLVQAVANVIARGKDEIASQPK